MLKCIHVWSFVYIWSVLLVIVEAQKVKRFYEHPFMRMLAVCQTAKAMILKSLFQIITAEVTLLNECVRDYYFFSLKSTPSLTHFLSLINKCSTPQCLQRMQLAPPPIVKQMSARTGKPIALEDWSGPFEYNYLLKNRTIEMESLFLSSRRTLQFTELSLYRWLSATLCRKK